MSSAMMVSCVRDASPVGTLLKVFSGVGMCGAEPVFFLVFSKMAMFCSLPSSRSVKSSFFRCLDVRSRFVNHDYG